MTTIPAAAFPAHIPAVLEQWFDADDYETFGTTGRTLATFAGLCDPTGTDHDFVGARADILAAARPLVGAWLLDAEHRNDHGDEDDGCDGCGGTVGWWDDVAGRACGIVDWYVDGDGTSLCVHCVRQMANG